MLRAPFVCLSAVVAVRTVVIPGIVPRTVEVGWGRVAPDHLRTSRGHSVPKPLHLDLGDGRHGRRLHEAEVQDRFRWDEDVAAAGRRRGTETNHSSNTRTDGCPGTSAGYRTEDRAECSKANSAVYRLDRLVAAMRAEYVGADRIRLTRQDDLVEPESKLSTPSERT